MPSHVFKSGTVLDNTLYTCTNTEVVSYCLEKGEFTTLLSLPTFNDLHHVAPTRRGTLLVTSTGLDAVLEYKTDGTIVRSWDVISFEQPEKLGAGTDYRMVETTKPHRSHPNFTFEIGDDVWVTRFHQSDAVCLTDQSKRIGIGVGNPHDGIVQNEKIHFTTTNGHIVVAGFDGNVIDDIDLNTYSQGDQPLGWCRAISPLSDDCYLVGFSRLRMTAFTDSIQWVKKGLEKIGQGTLGKSWHRPVPTNITCYDVRNSAIQYSINLEKYDVHAVFSLHVV